MYEKEDNKNPLMKKLRLLHFYFNVFEYCAFEHVFIVPSIYCNTIIDYIVD